MAVRLYTVLEHPVSGEALPNASQSGGALARIVEAHPALIGLMDFQNIDPVQIALQVGMVYPYEEDAVADLAELDLGPPDWFEPSAGLAAIRQALATLRADPASVAAVRYDPGLHAADVIADLEEIERTLVVAQRHETRFHWVLGETPEGIIRVS